MKYENAQFTKNIRTVKLSDAQAILDIYAPYITNTTVTFEYQVPSLEAFTKRIDTISKEYPYLVWEEDGKILGYAYGSKYAEREAYRFSTDLSIYLCPDSHGKKIGTQLYSILLDLLQKEGYRTLYAVISHPNLPSEGFHKALGFEEFALFKKTGYKFGKWIDVLWMQKTINPYDQNPILEKDKK